MREENGDVARGDAGCGGCPLHTRRDFLRDAAMAVGATLAAAGMLPGSALAAAPRVVRAMEAAGAERRYPLPAADGVQIDAENDVIVARVGGDVHAFSLACPHQRTALRWEPANNRFRCPKHKSTFTPSGVFVSGRATRPMDRHPVRRDGDAIVVDVDTVLRFDKARDAWERAVVKVGEK